MQHISATELALWLADINRVQPTLLDVREASEYQTCAIPGASLVPMNSIPTRYTEFDINAPIVCICHHGGRSLQVAHFLEKNEFLNVTNLTGGIHAWAQQVDPSMPTY